MSETIEGSQLFVEDVEGLYAGTDEMVGGLFDDAGGFDVEKVRKEFIGMKISASRSEEDVNSSARRGSTTACGPGGFGSADMLANQNEENANKSEKKATLLNPNNFYSTSSGNSSIPHTTYLPASLPPSPVPITRNANASGNLFGQNNSKLHVIDTSKIPHSAFPTQCGTPHGGPGYSPLSVTHHNLSGLNPAIPPFTPQVNPGSPFVSAPANAHGDKIFPPIKAVCHDDRVLTDRDKLDMYVSYARENNIRASGLQKVLRMLVDEKSSSALCYKVLDLMVAAAGGSFMNQLDMINSSASTTLSSMKMSLNLHKNLSEAVTTLTKSVKTATATPADREKERKADSVEKSKMTAEISALREKVSRMQTTINQLQSSLKEEQKKCATTSQVAKKPDNLYRCTKEMFKEAMTEETIKSMRKWINTQNPEDQDVKSAALALNKDGFNHILNSSAVSSIATKLLLRVTDNKIEKNAKMVLSAMMVKLFSKVRTELAEEHAIMVGLKQG